MPSHRLCHYWKQTEPLRVERRIRQYLADIGRGLPKVKARICPESLRKPKKTLWGPAMARQPLTADFLVRYQAAGSGICGKQCGSGTGLLSEHSDSTLPPPISYIPQVLHTHSFTYQRHYMTVTPDGITHHTTKHINKYRLHTGLDSNRDTSKYKPKSLPFHQPTQRFASNIHVRTDFI